MLDSLARFQQNISDARSLNSLYSYLKNTIGGPVDFDDLLRFQLVYSVSAFDKLVHDIIRVGMVATYIGTRPATSKYDNDTISIKTHGNLVAATVPPASVLFEQEISRKLGYLAFQDPDNVADGLSLIWQEGQKWQKISFEMSQKPEDVRRRLKLIVVRRNRIVHEADIDPLTGQKTPITSNESNDVTDFLASCGTAVVKLVQ